MMCPIWIFDSSGEAYDACQCRDEIKTGHILIVPNEKVVGIAHTWPIAVTVERGNLHEVRSWALFEGDAWRNWIVQARYVAKELGYDIV